MEEIQQYMTLALEEAKKAYAIDEVPIGAIIVLDGKVIASAHNKKVANNLATAHAEMLAIEIASKLIGNWHLDDASLFVTLEPCAMCAGAIINSRIKNLYFGAWDTRFGCCGTLYNLPTDVRFNHRTEVVGGVLEEECANILSQFFKAKREEKKQQKETDF